MGQSSPAPLPYGSVKDFPYQTVPTSAASLLLFGASKTDSKIALLARNNFIWLRLAQGGPNAAFPLAH